MDQRIAGRFVNRKCGTKKVMLRLLSVLPVLAVVLLLPFARSEHRVSAQQPALAWESCGAGFECATLKVPIDYGKPNDKTLDLALIRLPAADRARRIGSMLVNPGGPGGSGFEFTRFWAKGLDKSIRDRFDIVGFDPRGIGKSTPVGCHQNLQAFAGADPSPDTQAEWDTLAKETKTLSDNCASAHGDYLQHLGTKNVARDMDRIRVAVGDAKLTYLGYSYGTVIGQMYADLFPANVRALVLDGAVDLALDTDDRTLTQIIGFDRAMDAFLAKCRKDQCTLTRNGDPGKAVDDLIAKAEAAPIPARGSDRPAGPGELLLGLIEPLYSESNWPSLERAIRNGLDGDGTQLVSGADRYLQREGNGDYQNLTEANIAVNCLDQPASKLPKEFKDFPAAAARFGAKSPRFGPAVATGLTCAYWQAKPDALAAPKAKGVPPILVVSTTGDPATPYGWGVAVAKQLPGAALLSYAGEGHTAYAGGDTCIDGFVNAYLINLTLPPAGTFCGDVAAHPVPPESAGSAPVGQPAQTAAPGQAGGGPVAGQPGAAEDSSESDAGLWFGLGLVAAAAVLGGLAVLIVRRR